MSQRPEETFWTDQVRVAIPIVGLVLLLGVFWFWADSLIGADSSAPPPTTVLTVIPDDTPTPSPTLEPTEPTDDGVTPPPDDETPTDTGDDDAADPTRTPRPTEEATSAPDESTAETSSDCGEQWCDGDTVVTTSDVRMRKDPTTSSDIVEELTAGVELVVIDDAPVEAEDYVWWNVRDEATGNEGWVVDRWLTSS